jgi:hypothetical protein
MGVLEDVTVVHEGLQYDKRQFIQMPMVKVRKNKGKAVPAQNKQSTMP